MGNTISYGSDEKLWVPMSNGGTTMMIDILTLSGSELAGNDWERSLTVFIARNDQAKFGFGTVGFDLADIAWTQRGFTSQQHFLVRVIENAAAGCRWSELSYRPRRDWALLGLAGLHRLARGVRPPEPPLHRWPEWVDTMRDADWPRCHRHDVLLHDAGCHLCRG